MVKPRRLPSTRRALTPDELEQINLAARGSGNDVLLDALLLRLHTETACRRGGALGLRLADLDTDRGLVRLTEKGATLRWQPITLDLAAHLDEHARVRGAVLPTDRLLRYRNGRAITSRRYDHLWKRIGEQLPWVAAQGVSTHWLRHTTLTWVERHFGYGVARAYAGHTDSTGPATTTYIKARPARRCELCRPTRTSYTSVPRPPKLVHPHRSVYKIAASRFTRRLRSTAGERQASASFGSICTYPRATKNRSSR